MPEELWTEVCNTVQVTATETSPKEKKCKEAKWLSAEALQIAERKREVKAKGEKERYTHFNAEFQRIAKRDKKAFLNDQCKDKDENSRMGERLEISSRKSEIPRGHFMQRNISCSFHENNKEQKWYGPYRSRRYSEEVARIHRRTIQKRSS